MGQGLLDHLVCRINSLISAYTCLCHPLVSVQFSRHKTNPGQYRAANYDLSKREPRFPLFVEKTKEIQLDTLFMDDVKILFNYIGFSGRKT
jgi:hypothetical protein